MSKVQGYRTTIHPDDRLPRPRGRGKKVPLKLPLHRPLPHLSVSRVRQPI